MNDKKFIVEVSARHVHLDRATMDILFGKGSQLTVAKDLSQPGQFACEERVDLVGPKNTLSRVSILGPLRSKSQAEVSITDSVNLGVPAPVRESGDVAGTPGIKLRGPNGEVELKEGLIAARRHLHMTPKDAAEFGLKDKDIVEVRMDTARPLTFGDVVVRVNDQFALAMHVDTDEGNAACISRAGDLGAIVKKVNK